MGTFTSKMRTVPYEKKLRNVEDYDIKHLFTDDV
jgi:hypothetical protein